MTPMWTNPHQARLRVLGQLHRHQTRLTGEPYVTHPLAVARILAEIDSDMLTVVAGLLHDTIEDGRIEDGRPVTREIIEERFGSEIALLVDGVSKLKKHSFQSRVEAQAQNFRKMFVNMASDIRVVIIKLADRLHNMRTVEVYREDRGEPRQRTLRIYARLPAASASAIFSGELEDLALKCPIPCLPRHSDEGGQDPQGARAGSRHPQQ